jgi:hypothetical protein
MSPYPACNSILLLDNAQIHKGDDIQELVESFGDFTFMMSPLVNLIVCIRLPY